MWVADLLAIGQHENVLEVGFGPGVVIRYLSERASQGRVVGIDSSKEMVSQARARNAFAVRSGRVELHRGSVDHLPFDDARFDKALAINSMQVWPDAISGLREMWRVLKPGGRLALGFTKHSGQVNRGLEGTLAAGGFADATAVEHPQGFCVLATKPHRYADQAIDAV
jgi:ubiquinone/menaquinone biosynthesis C-methylase UbiE